jgi:hypothetical protein
MVPLAVVGSDDVRRESGPVPHRDHTVVHAKSGGGRHADKVYVAAAG